MEAPSSKRFAVLVTRCILVACLIQSNYAEVCYLRSHRGYGGCIRWFLPADISNCTAIKLGGYTPMFYKRSQIIELEQPFISEDYEEVQGFLEKYEEVQGLLKPQVPSLATTHVKTMAEDSRKPVTTGEAVSDQSETATVPTPTTIPSLATTHETIMTEDSRKSVTTGEGVSDQSETATVSTPTAKSSQAISHVKAEATNIFEYVTTGDSTSDEAATVSEPIAVASMSQEATNQNGGNLTQPSTEMTFSTTECPNLECRGNMGSHEISLEATLDAVMDYNNTFSENFLRRCGPRKVVVCGCTTESGSFFPIGVTNSASDMCRCYKNGSLTCFRNTDVGNTVCDNLADEERVFSHSKMDTGDKLSIISRPTDCHDLYEAGFRENGIYCVYPTGWNVSSLMVRCDMGKGPQGGWTVIQRRVNGSVDFFRNWTEYKNGFGELNHEFWLGNENIYQLTNQKKMQLRIDMTNDEGKYHVIYDLFRIGNEVTGYELLELGVFQPDGIEYDAFRYHVNISFSTYDRDDDSASNNCAQSNHGGWWFTNCHMCYLNGVYGELQSPGIRWYRLPDGQYNIKSTEMKIRPVD